MSTTIEPSVTHQPLRRFLPIVLLLFLGSGCAALIYEIVWFQLLELVIGSSAVSLGVLLGTYMGGMCLGSLILPRLISGKRHPLRVYALLEAGIGICGLLVLFLLPLVSRLYAAHVGHGLWGIIFRGVLCACCLVPPTLLMGATLPAISRWLETSPRGISWLGFFYGGNIAGAVFGCLFAGFYLLRVHDMSVATFTAAGINVIVALIGFGLAGDLPFETPETAPIRDGRGTSGGGLVYLAISLSGLSSLGAEVVWTRLLSLLLGGTVYTFSIILAVFLVGLGIGASLGSMIAGGTAKPRLALGGCQLLLLVAMAWTAWMLTRSLPHWPINPQLSRSVWLTFQMDLARCFWAILPPTVLWGASFPIALAAVASPGQDPAHLVGRVYSANTIGAIVGAVGTSVFLIGWKGTQFGQQVLMAIPVLAALLMFLPWPNPDKAAHRAKTSAFSFMRAGALISVTSILGAILIRYVPQTPWQLVAHGRYVATYGSDYRLLYMGEGMNASVAVTETSDGMRNFHVSGKVEASTGSRDMRLQRMLGHIPALVQGKPETVLVVGCGAGVTAGSFLVYPSVKKIVICEIEPLIPKVVAQYFSNENYNVVNDPRVQIVFDDARHYVLTTKKKFDIITSDPIHPWVKGAATLYTKDYFELVKQHLNPGGVVTQWVPLYESNLGVVKSEVATFFDVFTNGTIWSNDDAGEGYDTVLMGSADPMQINVDEIQHRMTQTDSVARSLRDVGFHSAIGLLSTFAGERSELGEWLKGAEINRDRNLRLQFLAGLSPNQYDETSIYDTIVLYKRFPEKLFTGSPEIIENLRSAIEQTKTAK